VRWVDEECDEDLADSRLSRVFETERLNLVLVDVREGNATTLCSFDTSKFLQTLVVAVGTGRNSLSELVNCDERRWSYRSIS